jgi:hypothetical protein
MIHFRLDQSVNLFALILAFALVLSVASMATAKELRLSWDRNDEVNVAGYKVYCRLADEDYDYDRPAWYGAETSCELENLEENTNYYFIVRAYNTSGMESEDSEEVEYDYESGDFITVGINSSNGYGTTSLNTTLDGAGLSGSSGATGGGGSCFIDSFLFP